MSDGPFAGIGIDIQSCIDDTLPPDHIKLLNGHEAFVFRLDLETECSTLVARWPEAG